MAMSKEVDEEARKTAGKRAIATEAFARALRQVRKNENDRHLLTPLLQLPTILANNAGLDSSDLVARLRKAVYGGMSNSGLDLMTPGGGITDMRELGVVESYKLKRAVVSSASEAAELLLRVDNIIRAAPRQRQAM